MRDDEIGISSPLGPSQVKCETGHDVMIHDITSSRCLEHSKARKINSNFRQQKTKSRKMRAGKSRIK